MSKDMDIKSMGDELPKQALRKRIERVKAFYAAKRAEVRVSEGRPTDKEIEALADLDRQEIDGLVAFYLNLRRQERNTASNVIWLIAVVILGMMLISGLDSITFSLSAENLLMTGFVAMLASAFVGLVRHGPFPPDEEDY
jgi:hypothetical protein